MRIGIIGASFARAAYLPALQLLQHGDHPRDQHGDEPGDRDLGGHIELVSVASARLDSARAAADAFAVPHAYDDWKQMLAEHPLDLVCIATPTRTHAPMVLAALASGAHVLCEKPMAMDAQEAEAMLARAQALGRVHMIGHELRFNAKRRRVRELIADGALGAIRHVAIQSIGSSWADPASRPEGDWWSSAEEGGGRLGANGSHQVDLLRWWLGEIVSVSGVVRTVVPERLDRTSGRPWKATADDFVEWMAEFETGTLASVMISTVARHGARNETVVMGSEGTITLSNDTERLMFGRGGAPLAECDVPEPLAGLPGIGPGIWNQSVVGAMRELVGAIVAQRPLREGATFFDGLRNQYVLDAVRASSRQRRWVEVSRPAIHAEDGMKTVGATGYDTLHSEGSR